MLKTYYTCQIKPMELLNCIYSISTPFDAQKTYLSPRSEQTDTDMDQD